MTGKSGEHHTSCIISYLIHCIMHPLTHHTLHHTYISFRLDKPGQGATVRQDARLWQLSPSCAIYSRPYSETMKAFLGSCCYKPPSSQDYGGYLRVVLFQAALITRLLKLSQGRATLSRPYSKIMKDASGLLCRGFYLFCQVTMQLWSMLDSKSIWRTL